MIYFISDTHFFSENIIRYCNRPFENAANMNKQLIENWNAVVKPEDTVYHLGDFVMHESENIPPILEQLNGKIILVRGNHDTRRKLSVISQYSEKVVDIKDIAYLQYKSLFFVASHFPMTNTDFLDMVVQDNSEVVVVHGHVHDKTPFFTPKTHSFNVSCDVTNFAPVPISRMWKQVKEHFEEVGVWRKEGVVE